MLHLVKNSPFATDSLALCLAYVKNNDSILLLEDGVIAAIAQQAWLKKLEKSKANLFALQDDVIARNLADQMASSVVLVDIQEFIELTEQHETILTW